MSHKMNRKTLVAALMLSGLGLASGGAQAASYYYSLFELSNITLLGQFKKDMNNNGTYEAGTDLLVWARPGSNESTGRAATFRGVTSASNSLGGSSAGQDQATFAQHVPPPGAFPVDASQAYTGAAAAENTFGQSGIAGEYSRGDSYMSTNTPTLNPFGVFQSGGENSKLVVEGQSLSTVNYASSATNTFTGYLDFFDKDFDESFFFDPDGPGGPAPELGHYDSTNLGWTGLVRLDFDYNYDLEMTSDPLDPGSTASRNMLFQMAKDTTGGTGTPPGFNGTTLVAAGGFGFGAMNCDVNGDDTYGENCASELGTSGSASYGTSYAEQSLSGAAFSQVFDLTSTLNQGRYYYQISFSQDVAGSAEAYPVPEPGILALIGLGILGLGFARRSRG